MTKKQFNLITNLYVANCVELVQFNLGENDSIGESCLAIYLQIEERAWHGAHATNKTKTFKDHKRFLCAIGHLNYSNQIHDFSIDFFSSELVSFCDLLNEDR